MKTCVCILFISIFIFGYQYSAISQVRVGAKAGLNLADENWNNFGGDVETKLIPTFMIGGVVEFDMNENWGIGAGIQYIGKGTEVPAFKTVMSYLQIPAQLQYRSNGFFAALGPYYAVAISGKYKQDSGNDLDIEFGNTDDDDFSPSDYGANLEIGYEFQQLRVTGLYSQGLANIVPADVRPLFDGSVKNVVFGVGLTYLFGE